MRKKKEGETYSIQYLLKGWEEYNLYQKKHAPALQKEHQDKYGSKCVAFRTVFEVFMLPIHRL